MSRHNIYPTDLITGIVASLAKSGARSFSIRTHDYDRAFCAAYEALEREAEALGLWVAFRVRLDPIHGNSETAQEAFYHAMASRLVTTDVPPSGRAKITITAEEAPAYLDRLPGGPALYARLARTFADGQARG